ncbi:MAG: putative C-S lyase [Clostridiales bacterium]|nr:putative C-S lyase [Clostridiales bacterium]
MTFDAAFFDEPIDRRGTDCEKWDAIATPEERDLLPMWVADMDFRCAPAVTDALLKRAAHPVYGYTRQSEAAVEAMLGFLHRRHGLSLTPDQQLMLPCVVTGLKAAVRALTGPGDAVLVQPPVYGPFFASVLGNGRKVMENRLLPGADGRYAMDWEGLEAALAGPVKLALVCNPHNPVSRVWTREEMARLYALCVKHGVTLAADEIHADFVYDRDTFASALLLDEREEAPILVFASASKTFNLAGLQQAVLLTRNPTLREAIGAQLRHAGAVSGNIFAMTATEAAYRHGDAWLDGLLAYLDTGRKRLTEAIARALPSAVITPIEATYLAWADLRAYGLSTAELMRRTREEGVVFSSGLSFDRAMGEGFLRINFACPHRQTLEAVARLEKALAGHTR